MKVVSQEFYKGNKIKIKWENGFEKIKDMPFDSVDKSFYIEMLPNEPETFYKYTDKNLYNFLESVK